MKDWSYFDKFEELNEQYLPGFGEGETIATQTVTAICKLVYKWYNDGDVYDNVHSHMTGWANDLSSYANWLYEQFPTIRPILMRINDCRRDGDYEDILADVADELLTEDLLAELDKQAKRGSVYEAEGPFEFDYNWDDEDEEDDDDWDDEDEDEWDDEDDYDDEEEDEDW